MMDFGLHTACAWIYPLVALICFLAALVGGVSGFGSGLIISAAVAPIFGVTAVVPLVSVVMLITNATRIWAYASALNLRLAALLLSTSVPGSLLGAYVYVHLDKRTVSLLLGLVLLASAPLSRYLKSRRFVAGLRVLAASGAIFGFMSSSVVGAGILILPLLLSSGLAGTAVLATDAAIALGTSIVRVLAFGALDALTLQLGAIGLVMGLCTIPGTWAAAWLMKRTNVRIHTAFMEAFIALAGLSFILHGTNLL